MDGSENAKICTVIITCADGKQLMVFLDQHRVEFSYINVDELEGDARGEMVKEVKELNKPCTLFTPIVGEHVGGGFKEAEVGETLQI